MDQICKLMLRWNNAKALPMNCCEGPEWEDFIKAVRPALVGRTLNYDKIRRARALLPRAPAVSNAGARPQERQHAEDAVS